ncbi:MAG: protein kinase, partial [Myxococcota bacterium]|nr:protein kinase [Myxococcota bacterium]
MTATEDLVRVGRYTILRSLGQGAMADVYLAELTTSTGFKRKVALKVVRDEFARDPKFAALLTREAMIGSYLQHPNIVETLEFDDVDGRMFLALEFVEGHTVEDLLERRKAGGDVGISADVAVEIIIQVLRGLSYAHNLNSPDDG